MKPHYPSGIPILRWLSNHCLFRGLDAMQRQLRLFHRESWNLLHQFSSPERTNEVSNQFFFFFLTFSRVDNLGMWMMSFFPVHLLGLWPSGTLCRNFWSSLCIIANRYDSLRVLSTSSIFESRYISMCFFFHDPHRFGFRRNIFEKGSQSALCFLFRSLDVIPCDQLLLTCCQYLLKLDYALIMFFFLSFSTFQ